MPAVRDGWDANTRIGLVVPHADVGPECEFSAMVPSTVSVHAARVHFAAMRPGGLMDQTIPHGPVRSFTEPPAVDDAVEQVAAAPVNVVACAFTSSAYINGVIGEESLLRRLMERSRGLPVIGTCPSAVRALHHLKRERLAIIHPPWFDAELAQLGARYFADAGLEVVHSQASGLPSGQPRITIEALVDDVHRQVPERADAVFLAGNGLRAVGAVTALEEALQLPVLTANQVLLWAALDAAGAGQPVSGYGQLLETAASSPTW